jgi:hypothetical protein
MKDIILDKLCTYEPGEFLPVMDGHELLNKKEFIIYKTKYIVRKLASRH